MNNEIWCGLNDEALKQCCCKCIFHLPVHFHCVTQPQPSAEQRAAAGVSLTDSCVCGVRKGWACVNLSLSSDKDTLEGVRVEDNWLEHSAGCECYTTKEMVSLWRSKSAHLYPSKAEKMISSLKLTLSAPESDSDEGDPDCGDY